MAYLDRGSVSAEVKNYWPEADLKSGGFASIVQNPLHVAV